MFDLPTYFCLNFSDDESLFKLYTFSQMSPSFLLLSQRLGFVQMSVFSGYFKNKIIKKRRMNKNDKRSLSKVLKF